MNPLIPIVLGVAMPLLAQTSGAPAKTTPTALTLTGCLRDVVDEPGRLVLVQTGREAKPAGPSVYRLQASAETGLNAHLGREVSVTGMVKTAVSQTPPRDWPSGKVPASLTSADVKDAPELSVSAVRRVADECASPTK